MEKKKLKVILNRSLISLFIALVVIQLFHPTKNNTTTITADDITRLYPTPDSVALILQKACYDCHSNNTHYPWYNRIQPVAWWLNDHIEEGKSHVNFSEFGKYPIAKQAKKLKKCAKEMDEGDMPLNFYLWIHKEAVLTPREQQLVMDWANNLSLQLSTKMVANP